MVVIVGEGNKGVCHMRPNTRCLRCSCIIGHNNRFRNLPEMSRPADNLPSSARAIALLLSSTPSIQDVQPGVLHQLLEFSHRYTAQVLTDAGVYAEHAGRSSKLEMDDIVLAVQARVGWEFGGRVPKEVIATISSRSPTKSTRNSIYFH